MTMGSSISPISAHSSMTPAAAGTNGEEQANFLDLLELHDAEAERGQEQQQAVDAGRDGEREHCVADLAQKTERQNTRKLKQIVRKDASFGSTEQENTK